MPIYIYIYINEIEAFCQIILKVPRDIQTIQSINQFQPNMQQFMKNTSTPTPELNYEHLLKQFPKIKFSYESKSYKKVSNNNNNNINNANVNKTEEKEEVFFIIPKGKKYFVWFKNNECIFLELDHERHIVSTSTKKPSRIFPNDTILYGTYFFNRILKDGYSSHSSYSQSVEHYFSIENIHYYDGTNLDTTTVFEKLENLTQIFKSKEKQQRFAVDIGLPHISSSFKEVSEIKPSYSAYCIQKKQCNNASNEFHTVFYYNSKYSSLSSQVASIPATAIPVPIPKPNFTKDASKTNNNSSNNGNGNNRFKIFVVRADIQNDIYHLSDLSDSSSALSTDSNANENIASIPDYKTSVMMNSLFRSIKENKSLDALEESDDEDEFENINLDKFVDLSKKVKMKCVYNYKFKKWTPIAPITPIVN